MTAVGREFQVAGAAQLNDHLPMSVRLKGTSRNGIADDRSDRVRHCVLWRADWNTPSLPCAVSWTSARTSRIGDTLLHRQLMQFLQQRVCVTDRLMLSWSLHCSVPAAACGWCWMERRVAQRYSSQSWKGSDYMPASVRGPQSLDVVCGGSPVRGIGLVGFRALSVWMVVDVRVVANSVVQSIWLVTNKGSSYYYLYISLFAKKAASTNKHKNSKMTT